MLKRKNYKGSKAKSKREQVESEGPPKIIVNLMVRKYTMRWRVATAVTASAYTYSALMQSIVLKSSAATVQGALLLFEAVKLLRIQMWAPATLGSQIAFEANANQGLLFGSDSRRWTDTSTTTANSAYLDWSPRRRMDLSGAWINPGNTLVTTSQVIGFFRADVNAIIDITFAATVTDGSFPEILSTASITAAGAGTYVLQWDANINSVDYNMVQP